MVFWEVKCSSTLVHKYLNFLNYFFSFFKLSYSDVTLKYIRWIEDEFFFVIRNLTSLNFKFEFEFQFYFLFYTSVQMEFKRDSLFNSEWHTANMQIIFSYTSACLK